MARSGSVALGEAAITLSFANCRRCSPNKGGRLRNGIRRANLLPGLRIERKHPVEPGAEIQRVVYDDGRGRVARARGSIAAVRKVAAAMGPGDLQTGHILGRDLVEFGPAFAPLVASVLGPVGDGAKRPVFKLASRGSARRA